MVIDAVKSTILALLRTLPNCCYLHISIAGEMKYWTAHQTKLRASVKNRVSLAVGDLLIEVMAPLRSLGELQDVGISLPPWLYDLWRAAIKDGEILKSVHHHPNVSPGVRRLGSEECWGKWCANGFWVMSGEINDFYREFFVDAHGICR